MEARTISTGDLLLRIARDESLAYEAALFVQLHDVGGVAFEVASFLCTMAAARREKGCTPDAKDVQYCVNTKFEEYEAALDMARDYYRLYPSLVTATDEAKATNEEGA